MQGQHTGTVYCECWRCTGGRKIKYGRSTVRHDELFNFFFFLFTGNNWIICHFFSKIVDYRESENEIEVLGSLAISSIKLDIIWVITLGLKTRSWSKSKQIWEIRSFQNTPFPTSNSSLWLFIKIMSGFFVEVKLRIENSQNPFILYGIGLFWFPVLELSFVASSRSFSNIVSPLDFVLGTISEPHIG